VGGGFVAVSTDGGTTKITQYSLTRFHTASSNYYFSQLNSSQGIAGVNGIIVTMIADTSYIYCGGEIIGFYNSSGFSIGSTISNLFRVSNFLGNSPIYDCPSELITDNNVYSSVFANNNQIAFGGDFQNVGTNLNSAHCALWNISTNSWTGISSSSPFNGSVRNLAVSAANNQHIIATGLFTEPFPYGCLITNTSGSNTVVSLGQTLTLTSTSNTGCLANMYGYNILTTDTLDVYVSSGNSWVYKGKSNDPNFYATNQSGIMITATPDHTPIAVYNTAYNSNSIVRYCESPTMLYLYNKTNYTYNPPLNSFPVQYTSNNDTAFCNISPITIAYKFVIASVTLYAPLQSEEAAGPSPPGTVIAQFIVVENPSNLSVTTYQSSTLTIQMYANYTPNGNGPAILTTDYPQTYNVNATINPGSYYFGWNALYGSEIPYMLDGDNNWIGSVYGYYSFP
jgi:hypothetical protein